MKNLNQITGIIFIILILFSCKKEKLIPPPVDSNTVTLTGKLVKNCEGDILSNYPVDIWLYYGNNLETTKLYAKTKADGNFEWTFDKPKGLFKIKFRHHNGGHFFTFHSKHRDLGDIIVSPTCNVVMKIKVNNPYSVGDTLQLKDFTDYTKGIRIGAPFKDTVLSVAYDYAELRWPLSFEQKNTTYVSTNIYI